MLREFLVAGGWWLRSWHRTSGTRFDFPKVGEFCTPRPLTHSLHPPYKESGLLPLYFPQDMPSLPLNSAPALATLRFITENLQKLEWGNFRALATPFHFQPLPFYPKFSSLGKKRGQAGEESRSLSPGQCYAGTPF